MTAVKQALKDRRTVVASVAPPARAESLNNVVMDATPNGILVVDDDLRIQDISPSAGRLLCCNRLAVRGRALAEIIPPVQDFVSVSRTGASVLNKLVQVPAATDRGQSALTLEVTIVPVGGST